MCNISIYMDEFDGRRGAACEGTGWWKRYGTIYAIYIYILYHTCIYIYMYIQVHIYIYMI